MSVRGRAFSLASGVLLAAAVFVIGASLYRQHTRSTAAAAEIQSDFRALAAAEDSFHMRTGRYSALFGELGIKPRDVRHVVLTGDGWYTLASRSQPVVSCSVWVGSTGMDPADEERVPACEETRDWRFLWFAGALMLLSAIFATLGRLRDHKTSLTQVEHG